MELSCSGMTLGRYPPAPSLSFGSPPQPAASLLHLGKRIFIIQLSAIFWHPVSQADLCGSRFTTVCLYFDVFLAGLWATQHFNHQMCPLCPLVVSPLDLFLEPPSYVWQWASWVTSPNNHLDVFRTGTRAGNQSTGLPLPLPQPAPCGPSESRQASVPGLFPPGHMGLPMGSRRTTTGHLPVPHPPGSITLAQVFLTGNVHQTRNRKKQRDQVLYSPQSAACLQPIMPVRSPGGRRDYNHLHSEMRNLGLAVGCRLLPHLS